MAETVWEWRDGFGWVERPVEEPVEQEPALVEEGAA